MNLQGLPSNTPQQCLLEAEMRRRTVPNEARAFRPLARRGALGREGWLLGYPSGPSIQKWAVSWDRPQLRNSMSRTWIEGQLDGFLCNQYLKLVVFRHFGQPCGQVEESKIDKDIFYEAKRLGCVTWSAVPNDTCPVPRKVESKLAALKETQARKHCEIWKFYPGFSAMIPTHMLSMWMKYMKHSCSLRVVLNMFH